MTREKAVEIFEGHKTTGEPLSEEEVTAIVAYKLADETDFWHTGGGLFRFEPGTDPNVPIPDEQPDNDPDYPEEPGDGYGDSIEAAEAAVA